MLCSSFYIKALKPLRISKGLFYFRGVPADGYTGQTWNLVFVGSNPTTPTGDCYQFIDIPTKVCIELDLFSCGAMVSITDFDSVDIGSNPIRKSVFVA